MKELALHILDIAKNSVSAGASLITVEISERGNLRTLVISDNGCGMEPELLAQVSDPFTTTRTTRSVGMGIPLLKLSAELTGGNVSLSSSVGEDHGTEVRAEFFTDHIDCIPIGAMADTVVTLIQGNPEIDFLFRFPGEKETVSLDTRELRAVLEDVPLDTPDVLVWIREACAG